MWFTYFYLHFISACRDLDICIIVDASISVSDSEWYDQANFLEDFVRCLDIGPTKTQVSFVTYSTTAVVSAYLNKYATQTAAINGVRNDIKHQKLSTQTDKALLTAALDVFGDPAKGDRPDKDNLVVLLTGGPSHSDVAAAAAILRSQARIITIGIDRANILQLNNIVNNEPSSIYYVQLYSDLAGQVGNVLDAACGEYSFECIGEWAWATA